MHIPGGLKDVGFPCYIDNERPKEHPHDKSPRGDNRLGRPLNICQKVFHGKRPDKLRMYS